MDTVFRNAWIVDGTGGRRYRGDVGITNDCISAIDTSGSRELTARRIIDADQMLLAPGFIDMHSHSDLALLTDTAQLAKVSQGCTFEVLGQDGLGYAPVDDSIIEPLWNQLAAWNGRPAIDPDWRSVAGYLDRIDAGCAVNAAYLVPHGTVRMLVMGWQDRRATPSELLAMQRLVARGLADGAIGMSAGLSYPPGMYADTAELAALCEVVADHDGYFAPHQRSYGAGALDGYAEMIEIGRRSGCAVHLTHATMNFQVNAGRAGELIALIDSSTDCDITLDSYPYLPGATSLSALLPSWTVVGGLEQCAQRLRDPELRKQIRYELDVAGTDGCHGVAVDWDSIEVSGVTRDHNRRLVGMSLSEAADGISPSEFYLDLLLDESFEASCLMHVGHEENVRTIMQHRRHMVGSDGLLAGDRPHPRAWGTFARYLGRYARDLGVLTIEECVAHMTGRPAALLGLAKRGIIAEGMMADIVLFDADAVCDTATFEHPRRQASGISYVLVNGQFVIDQGHRTEALPGRSVRRR